MIRPVLRSGVRWLRSAPAAAPSTARLAASVGRLCAIRSAVAGSAIIATATFATSCDAAIKYISTASGLKYRNLVVGKGPVATKGTEVPLSYQSGSVYH